MAKYAKQTEADGWQLPVCAGSLLEHSMWWGRQPHRRLQSSQSPAKLLSGGLLSLAHCPHPAKNQSTLMLILCALPEPVWDLCRLRSIKWTLYLGLYNKTDRQKSTSQVSKLWCVYLTAFAWLCRITSSLHTTAHHACTHWQIESSVRTYSSKTVRIIILITIILINHHLIVDKAGFDYRNPTNPSFWLVLEQRELTWGCVKIPLNRNLESSCWRAASQWQLLQEPGFNECVMSGVFSSC